MDSTADDALLSALQKRFSGCSFSSSTVSASVTPSGPSARGFARAPLRAFVGPTPGALRIESPELPPKVCAALALMWGHSLKDTEWVGVLPFARAALRALENFGADWLAEVVALQEEAQRGRGCGEAPPATAAAPAPLLFAPPLPPPAPVAPPPPSPPPALAAALPPASPPPAAPACTPLEAAFLGQDLWSAAEQRTFEAALRATFYCARPRRLCDAGAWAAVAAAVASPRATAASCAARYLALTRVVGSWVSRGSAAMPAATAMAAARSPEKAPPQVKAAAAVGAAGGWAGGAGGGEGGAASGGEAALEGAGSEDSASEAHSAEEEGQEEEEEEEDHGVQDELIALPRFRHVHLRPQPPPAGASAAGSVALKLVKPAITGVGALVCSGLTIVALCARCNEKVTLFLQGAEVDDGGGGGGSDGGGEGAPEHGVVKQWCGKCSLLLSAGLRAVLIHEGEPRVGIVDAPHLSVALPSHASLLASCVECGAVAGVDRYAPPNTWEAACRACHARLRIDARGWALEAWTGAGGGAPPPALPLAAALRGASLAAAAAAAKLPQGRPLPELGTCTHYKSSHRWLRFPCCGSAWPCDVCHDKGSDHPHEWAKRMICQFGRMRTRACARAHKRNPRLPNPHHSLHAFYRRLLLARAALCQRAVRHVRRAPVPQRDAGRLPRALGGRRGPAQPRAHVQQGIPQARGQRRENGEHERRARGRAKGARRRGGGRGGGAKDARARPRGSHARKFGRAGGNGDARRRRRRRRRRRHASGARGRGVEHKHKHTASCFARPGFTRPQKRCAGWPRSRASIPRRQTGAPREGGATAADCR
jgi:hypothetical protein